MSGRAQSEKDAAPAVSVIVISYYTGPVLARCLSSLRTQPEIGEIILIDNGNFPGEIERAVGKDASGAPIVILSGHGNIGFAAACNLGAAKAGLDYLLFLNPDAMMPDGGVRRLLEDGAHLERPWMMGAKLVGPDGEEQQGSRRETLTPWRAFVEAARLYKLAPRHPYFRRFNLHAHACPQHVTPVPTISGACFFMMKEDYLSIGGMDEQYFLHVEDVDFCLRFAKAGGVVYFTPFVSVTHFKSSSRASPIRIEARKTAGMIKYFNAHFADAYPKPFLWLVAGLLWALFAVLAVKRGFAKLVRLIGVAIRSGPAAAKRALAIFGRRSSR